MPGTWSKEPHPDFSELLAVLSGEQAPRRVHMVDLGMDKEMAQALMVHCLDRPGNVDTDKEEGYWRQRVEAFYWLGYDCVPTWAHWHKHPDARRNLATNTALLPSAEREWVDEKRGLISSPEEFEQFPWDEIVPDTRACDFAARHLPAGMKLTVSATLFEHVLETLLGYEGLFFLLHDEPDLVAQVFDRWGQKVYDFYAAVIDREEIGAIFHADDLGFNTSTLISPKVIRRLFLPWLKRYVDLAHAHGKPLWYHCCGNIYKSGLIEDLLADVQIDAFHAFQEIILPVTEFKARYGHRVATLGGVDVDSFARLDEPALRAYVRNILDHCMPGGRFALGSGNSVTNYIPLENYLTVVDEAGRWGGREA